MPTMNYERGQRIDPVSGQSVQSEDFYESPTNGLFSAVRRRTGAYRSPGFGGTTNVNRTLFPAEVAPTVQTPTVEGPAVLAPGLAPQAPAPVQQAQFAPPPTPAPPPPILNVVGGPGAGASAAGNDSTGDAAAAATGPGAEGAATGPGAVGDSGGAVGGVDSGNAGSAEGAAAGVGASGPGAEGEAGGAVGGVDSGNAGSSEGAAAGVGSSGAAAGDGGGGAGGAKVLCTHFRDRGLIHQADYHAAHNGLVPNARVMAGYLWWGVPMVRWLRKSPNGRRVAFILMLCRFWTDHMAHKRRPALFPVPCYIGAAVHGVGSAVCWLLGLIAPSTDWKSLYRENDHAVSA